MTPLITFILFLSTISTITGFLYYLTCHLLTYDNDKDLKIDNLYAYECGYSSFNDARNSFDIKFYLVALLFLIFDLEIILLLPFAVTISVLNFYSIFIVYLFLTILTLGFYYEWCCGGLDW